jgi:hypothetical protein
MDGFVICQPVRDEYWPAALGVNGFSRLEADQELPPVSAFAAMLANLVAVWFNGSTACAYFPIAQEPIELGKLAHI